MKAYLRRHWREFQESEFPELELLEACAAREVLRVESVCCLPFSSPVESAAHDDFCEPLADIKILSDQI